MQLYDAIIVGAGHNGLVTAAYLARAGKKVLVLEQRATIGGIAATEEIYPGFKYSTCAHQAGAFAPEIIGGLELTKHGLELLPLETALFAPHPEGRSLWIPQMPSKAAEEIGRFSRADAEKFPRFCSRLNKLAGFLRALYRLPLPDYASAERLDLRALIKTAWQFHRLGRKEQHEFLRILPMSVADLLGEWFETDLLKAAVGAGGLLGAFVGPRQQGTALGLLHHQPGRSNGAFGPSGSVRGGINRLPQALARAAQSHGAEIRTGTEVAQILAPTGTASGVVLQDGAEIQARVVIANTDAKRTFLKLLEPTYLDPQFLLQIKNIRSRGTVAKVNLALDNLPRFRGGPDRSSPAHLAGVIRIGPTLDYLERAADDAKYGRWSKAPFLEITIPSVADPTLAPAGKHVMSVWMQYAPYRLRDHGWNDQRDALGDAVVNTIEEHAAGFKNSILHRQVLTPLDLEQTFGLTEGHLYHAEMALDQIFFMRPVAGWARYKTPIENLYLCGSAAHPGGGITGLPGYYAAKRVLQAWARNK